MVAMRLQAISLLLHGFVGWRLVPALDSPVGAVALAVLLLVSALTLPYGLGARRGGSGRGAARAGVDRSRVHGAVLVAVRADGAARPRPLARRRLRGALARTTVVPASLVTPSARAVAVAALLVTLWGFAKRAVSPASSASTFRSPASRPSSTASRSRR
jgi:hypothetical protein